MKSNIEEESSQQQELYVQIRDDVADQIIQHGLSKTESKLFFYLLKLDRFGDRPAKLKVAEILLATGIGKTAYHDAMNKFEIMGWFDFKHSEVEISNYCMPGRKPAKPETQSEIPNSRFGISEKKFGKTNSNSAKTNSNSAKTNRKFGKAKNEPLEPAPCKASGTPQTLQTYSDLLHTLSDKTRESFEKFCKKKIEECSFKIGSRTAWLNKHGAEYLEEFKEMYSEALANPEVIAPKAEIATPSIEQLKRQYGSDWESAAIHFGLISPNSPTVENEEEMW